MTRIIDECVARFKDILTAFNEREDISLGTAEVVLTKQIYGLVAEYLGALYEAKDDEIRINKAQRKADGLVVERRNDKRQLVSSFGVVSYKRTYYKVANGYDYPVDHIAGIEQYSRISSGTSIALAATACTNSYENSSRLVTGGAVSRQTVMRKIRLMEIPETPSLPQKKKVSVLHIDADEDHVSLQNGKNVIVPIVCIYEGKEKVCKGRNRCINAFSVSKYGSDYDGFWDSVLTEVEARYDISDATIYLHADGGSWIQKAKDWFPNLVFVLDDYHKNKAIKRAVSGIARKDAEQYAEAIRDSFLEGDARLLTEIRDSLLLTYPERSKTIQQGLDYLIRFFDAIHLRAANPDSVLGGASEPHVQHVLSERLSSTPKAWSEETLKHLVPILAARQSAIACPIREVSTKEPHCEQVEKKQKMKNTAGMIDPDLVIYFPAEAYKKTSLSTTLKAYGRQRF